MDAAEEKEELMRRYAFAELATIYLTHLLESQLFESAANKCKRLLRDDPQLWHKFIVYFDSFNQISVSFHPTYQLYYIAPE